MEQNINPEIKLYLYVQYIFHKGTKIIQSKEKERRHNHR